MMKKRKQQGGQVALSIILVLVVVGVIVLSVVSRSVSGIRQTSVEESAARALKIAEAGIEEGLRTLTEGTFTGEELNYSVEVSREGAGGFLTGAAVAPGDVVEVTLDQGQVDSPTGLAIYWANADDGSESPAGAVEVLQYQEVGGSYQVIHSPFDPDASRRGENHFAPSAGAATALGVNFAGSATIPLSADDKVVRIRVYYNQMSLGVAPVPDTATLPGQQYRVVSTGEVEGGVVRKVEAVRSNPVLPVMFDAALYSGADLTQQTR